MYVRRGSRDEIPVELRDITAGNVVLVRRSDLSVMRRTEKGVPRICCGGRAQG